MTYVSFHESKSHNKGSLITITKYKINQSITSIVQTRQLAIKGYSTKLEGINIPDSKQNCISGLNNTSCWLCDSVISDTTDPLPHDAVITAPDMIATDVHLIPQRL